MRSSLQAACLAHMLAPAWSKFYRTSRHASVSTSMLPRLLAGKFHACLKLPLTDIDPLRNYEAGVLHVKGAWAVYTRDIAREHSNGLSL